MQDEFADQFADTLRAMPETDARLERIPPGFIIATGHDDDVMVFAVRVGDPTATVSALLPLLTMTKSNFVLGEFARTKGLIRKRISIDAAQRLRETLNDAGTEIEFVRPIQD